MSRPRAIKDTKSIDENITLLPNFIFSWIYASLNSHLFNATLNDHVVISLFSQLSSPSFLPPKTYKGFHYLLGNDVLDKQWQAPMSVFSHSVNCQSTILDQVEWNVQLSLIILTSRQITSGIIKQMMLKWAVLLNCFATP